MTITIFSLKARQISDSRGNPTVEADVELSDKFVARAAIPSGASTEIQNIQNVILKKLSENMESGGFVTGLVYINGEAFDDAESGVIFRSVKQAWFTISERATFKEFKAVMTRIVYNGNASTLKKIQFRCPKEMNDWNIRFKKALIKHDANVQLMFKYYKRFKDYIPGIELIVVAEEIGWNESQQYTGLDLNSYPIDQPFDDASSTNTFRDSWTGNIRGEEFANHVPEWDVNESEADEDYEEGEEEEHNDFQDHLKLNLNMIGNLIKGMISVDPSIKIKVIIEATASHFGYKLSYRKAWLAKQKAIELVYGNWEKSYNELPRWLTTLCHVDVGSVVNIASCPVYIENQLVQHAMILKRVFWTYRSCVKAFRHCKPLIQIDGTHLYGKYKGTLLVAVAQDGNRNIVPISFAIVEGETVDTWEYFLTNLRKRVVTGDGVTLIFDPRVSILAAIDRCGDDWKPPRAYPRFCLRHIVANFMRSFKKPYLNKIVVNMGYARTEREFMYHYNQLAKYGQIYTKWIDDIGGNELWTQAFDDGRRYGHMTTNVVECINSILKGARNLPITALVKTTYYRLIQLFSDKRKEIQTEMTDGSKFGKDVMNHIRKNQRESATLVVLEYSKPDQIFVVRDNSKDLKVEMRRMYCDCGNFQIDHYPCRHVIACCSLLRQNWETYVDDIYKLTRIYKVYERSFKAIGHEDTWSFYTGPEMYPNPQMLRRTWC